MNLAFEPFIENKLPTFGLVWSISPKKGDLVEKKRRDW